MDDYYGAREKKRLAAKKARKAKNIAHMDGLMRRVHGTLEVLNDDGQPAADMQPIPTLLLLVDLKLEGLSLFAGERLDEGTLVEVKTKIPNWYVLQAHVTWCDPANLSPGLLKPGSLQFRMGLKWNFGSENEMDQFRRIFQSLQDGI